MHGTIFDIQRFSLFDGPGVRTIVFLKGCPLKCIWCHNPEGIDISPQIMFDSSKCINCKDCAAVCHNSGHIFGDDGHIINRTDCDLCLKCADICCTKALSSVGKTMDAKEVIDEVLKDLPVFKESGGGLTLSGGEPFYQPDFAIELLRLAKNNNISTCIETSGYANSSKLREAARFTDYFYYDYKATGNEMHKRLCGVSQDKISENLALLNNLSAHVTLRCPIIPGQNDFLEHIQGIANTAKKFECVKEVHIEPYHRLGISKYNKIGNNHIFDTEVPERKNLKEYCQAITSLSGKKCVIS